MPIIIDYPQVLERMQRLGFTSNYHNGGAFSFPKGTPQHVVAHIGPPDPTIRAAALPFAIAVPPPHERNLGRLATRVWQHHLPGPAWVMPLAHWAFELDRATQPWFSELLRDLGLDPTPLVGLNTAAAIEFAPTEAVSFERLVEALLTHLKSSDFALGFPDHPVFCTLHHHKQLWWTTVDSGLAHQLRKADATDGPL